MRIAGAFFVPMALLGLPLAQTSEPIPPVVGIYGHVYEWSYVPDGTHPTVTGVAVMLTEVRTGETRTSLTDVDGLYSFDCVDLGEYKLRFVKEGYIPVSTGPLTYNHPDSLQMNEMLQPNFPSWGGHGQLWLRILDPAGEVVEGVRFSVDGGDWRPTASDRCGNLVGRFESGRHSIRLSRKGYRTESLEVVVGDKPTRVNVMLEPEE